MKTNSLYSIFRTIFFAGALVCIIGGGIMAAMKKEALSEFFGVGTFVLLAGGIVLDSIAEFVNKREL